LFLQTNKFPGIQGNLIIQVYKTPRFILGSQTSEHLGSKEIDGIIFLIEVSQGFSVDIVGVIYHVQQSKPYVRFLVHFTTQQITSQNS